VSCKETTFQGLRLERVLASKQFDGARFRNPTGKGAGLKGNPLPVLGEYFFGAGERRPSKPLPLAHPQEAWRAPSHSGLRVTWLGHSTVVLEIDGVTVLTDPVFGARVSPFQFAGPKRFHPPPAALDALPPIDIVLLSHDHYDHLCQQTMRAIAALDMPIVTSLGVGARLEVMGVAPDRVHELDWGEHIDLKGLRLTATPSQHFSGRSATDRNKTLWSSWVIKSDRRKVFFSGDSGLTDQFLDIRAQHGPFDLVMLEIGAFHESWGDIHLGPENALKALDMLGGGPLLPIHWGTFNLALHPWSEPIETLTQLADTQGKRVLTPMLGQAFEPSLLEGPTPWWR
jgi:L-ascorbate metabolism protein UlaG (beta-lactamase superfamily)